MGHINGNQKDAPHFDAQDVYGKKVDLAEIKSRYTLLVFLRYAGCPFCNLAIYRLSLEYERLKAESCEIIAFVQSSKEMVKKNIYERHDPKPQFSIIPDHDMTFYDKFDVGPSVLGSLPAITKIPFWLESVYKQGFSQQTMDGKFFMVPAWFLVNNETGKIVQTARGVSLYNQESFIPIYESLIFKD